MCEYIYELRQDWEKVFECYVDDTSRHGDILQFLRNVFVDPLAASSVRQMERAVLRHIQLLVKLNPTTLTFFLAINKPNLLVEAVNALTTFPHEKFRFLEAILELS